MKKVLILAYDFPPYVSVGALRPYSWYRYLNEFNVYPIVITRQWNNRYGNQLDYVASGQSKETIIEQSQTGTIIKTPYEPNLSNKLLLNYGEKRFRLIRKIITGFFEYIQFLFFVGPKVKLYFAAKAYLKENSVDAIIATGDPFILFKYASKLSCKYNIPWIADYRDPWIQNKKSERGNLFLRWQSLFEKKYLKNVSKITTVSSFVKVQIELNISKKEFAIVTNGFDCQNIEKINTDLTKNEYFSIGFVGTIYKWHPLNQFIETLQDFYHNNPNIRFQLNFYGVSGIENLMSIINNNYPEIAHNVFIYNRMPNLELLSALSKNNVFLLFNDYSILGTKIYDYLALKRRILLCFSADKESEILKRKHYHIKEVDNESKSLQADLITETNSGIVVKDKAHLKQVLNELYAEFTANGFVACNSTGTEKYSRKIQTQKLAEIIKEL